MVRLKCKVEIGLFIFLFLEFFGSEHLRFFVIIDRFKFIFRGVLFDNLIIYFHGCGWSLVGFFKSFINL